MHDPLLDYFQQHFYGLRTERDVRNFVDTIFAYQKELTKSDVIANYSLISILSEVYRIYPHVLKNMTNQYPTIQSAIKAFEHLSEEEQQVLKYMYL